MTLQATGSALTQVGSTHTSQQLQGRTLPKLVLSLCMRSKPPWMRLDCFYVLISRVRTFNGLRLLQHDKAALESVSKLQHDEYLYAWVRGYDLRGDDLRGRWSKARTAAALNAIRMARAAAKARRRQAKEKDRASKKAETAAAKRKRPGDSQQSGAGRPPAGKKCSR